MSEDSPVHSTSLAFCVHINQLVADLAATLDTGRLGLGSDPQSR